MLKNKLLSAMGGAPANYIEDVFSTYLYTGNGSTQTINNGIDLAGKGGLVWAKARSTTANHGLSYKSNFTHFSNLTDAETGPGVTFNSNGFTTAANGTVSNVGNGVTHASWTFRKAPKFFDVVTFSTNASSGTDSPVAHALASTPGCIIIKSLSTGNWFVWHRAMNATTPNRYRALLNSTFQAVDEGAEWIVPTSTSFNIPNSVGTLGASQTYVAYLFAHDAGGFGLTGTDNVISCGMATMPAGGGPVTVNLGWEPQWVLMKDINHTGGCQWFIQDNMRGWPSESTSAPDYKYLQAHLSSAEGTSNTNQGITSTGFSINSGFNYADGNTNIIYIAIRRGPMKTPTSGTQVYNAIARTGTGAAATVTGVGFAPDLAQIFGRDVGANWAQMDRLRGTNKPLGSNLTAAEDTGTDFLTAWGMDGVTLGANSRVNASGGNFINHFFRRAPGFFDVVCGTSNGSGVLTVSHNLGVSPELAIIKDRQNTASWYVVRPSTSAYLLLNSTAAQGGNLTLSWSSTSFSNDGNFNNANQVVYLFATLAGISKVGSYTGTGTTQQINCGFTAGARFVLIKRTDSTGDWYVWDSARGIVAGNDPYLLLNSTAAEVTTTDYVDTFSSGFEISSTAPAAINASGGTFIYLAIA